MTKVFCWCFLLWNSNDNNNNDDKYILLSLYSKTPCPKARNPLQPKRTCRSPGECLKIYASTPIIYSKPPQTWKPLRRKHRKCAQKIFFAVWFSEISLANWQTHVPTSITSPTFDLNLNFDSNSFKEFASLYSSRRFAKRGDVL